MPTKQCQWHQRHGSLTLTLSLLVVHSLQLTVSRRAFVAIVVIAVAVVVMDQDQRHHHPLHHAVVVVVVVVRFSVLRSILYSSTQSSLVPFYHPWHWQPIPPPSIWSMVQLQQLLYDTVI